MKTRGGRGKFGKGRGGGRGIDSGLDGGALLILEEPESSLKELELPLGELEPAEERLTISLAMRDFLFEKKKM